MKNKQDWCVSAEADNVCFCVNDWLSMFAKNLLGCGSVMKSTSIWELVELLSDLKSWNFHSTRLHIPGWGKLSVKLVITVIIQRNKNLLQRCPGVLGTQFWNHSSAVSAEETRSTVFIYFGWSLPMQGVIWYFLKQMETRNEIIVLCLGLLFCEALWKGIQDSILHEFWKLNFGPNLQCIWCHNMEVVWSGKIVCKTTVVTLETSLLHEFNI